MLFDRGKDSYYMNTDQPIVLITLIWESVVSLLVRIISLAALPSHVPLHFLTVV